MKDFYTLQTMPPEARGGVVVIGKFDGVHKGHQSVIETARAKADALAADIKQQKKHKTEPASIPLIVLIFDPHPRQFFDPNAPSLQLTRLTRRAQLLKSIGADFIIVLQFDEALANMAADDFISDILCRQLAVKAVCVGQDFRFGKARSGTTAQLKAKGKELGFELVLLDIVKPDIPNARPYSSTAIRAYLTQGDMQAAANMLGYFWRLEGVVEKGDGRGRQLNVPTANLAVTDYHLPRFGVYAIQAEQIEDKGNATSGRLFDGVANLGIRPSFDASQPKLEVHLFDFDGDLYGAMLCVSLIAFIRPEKKFDGTDALAKLTAQIAEDAARARQILASLDAVC
ncbi:MAG: bifunctional riboflavin kinase/FAD synthetase [Alphaproteobacteria bacterium]|nr:bifunctional riboflavin kinase/FAD synthetase [Alphaproteobacteria bacterium]